LTDLTIILPLIFLAAFIFSSVGHGGATAYLAVFALMAVEPISMRSAALCLNVLVASIALYKFSKVRAFDWQLFWPIALFSVPFAYLGGQITLPNHVYKIVVGLCLIVAAWSIFNHANKAELTAVKPVKKPVLMGLGAGLGLLAGLTGVGGGIFLSPILLKNNWAKTKVVSGVAAAFILANSLSGLISVFSKSPSLPYGLRYWAIAAIIGGYIGAEYGSKRLNNATIRKILALVLLFAGLRMAVSS
jgi:uncharacterized protein